MKLFDAISTTTLEAARQPVQKQHATHAEKLILSQQPVIPRLTLWSKLHALLSQIAALRDSQTEKDANPEQQPDNRRYRQA